MGTGEIVAGAGCGVAAAICFELGYVVQAGDARATEGGTAPLLARLVRRPRWLGGSALVVCGLALQLLALHFAPLSVVQPALVLGLGLLVVLAERRLGERLGLRGRLAVAAAAVAVVLIALGGQTGGSQGTGHPVIVLTALAAVVLAALILGYATRRGRVLVLAAGLGEAWAVIAAKVALIDLDADAFASAAAWGVAAALVGLMALNAEMSGLQRVPATVAGPLVLVTQAAVPVLLAPLAVGERWASPPAVLAGLALVVAAAVVLGRARVGQPEMV